MTINTIIAHNWAILYSGDSTTKISDIEGKTRSQAQPAKKLSGLETAKRKKKTKSCLTTKKILIFWPPKKLSWMVARWLRTEDDQKADSILSYVLLLLMFTIGAPLNSQLSRRCIIIINATSIFDSTEGKSKLILKLMGINVFQGLNNEELSNVLLLSQLCLPRCLTSHTLSYLFPKES